MGIPKLARSQLFRQACAQIWEKAMAPHSWKIPRMEEPGRLQSMGWLRVGHHWVTSFSLFTFMHRRRKWQPTPVFLPREPQRLRGLVGCHLWRGTGSASTEPLSSCSSSSSRKNHLSTEFQTIARRDKKAFLGDHCKEIEENNRVRKTRDLFKKIRDTKGTFHTNRAQ